MAPRSLRTEGPPSLGIDRPTATDRRTQIVISLNRFRYFVAQAKHSPPCSYSTKLAPHGWEVSCLISCSSCRFPHTCALATSLSITQIESWRPSTSTSTHPPTHVAQVPQIRSCHGLPHISHQIACLKCQLSLFPAPRRFNCSPIVRSTDKTVRAPTRTKAPAMPLVEAPLRPSMRTSRYCSNGPAPYLYHRAPLQAPIAEPTLTWAIVCKPARTRKSASTAANTTTQQAAAGRSSSKCCVLSKAPRGHTSHSKSPDERNAAKKKRDIACEDGMPGSDSCAPAGRAAFIILFKSLLRSALQIAP